MTASRGSWKPVLEGPSRAAAHEAIDAILADLLLVSDPRSEANQRRTRDPLVTILFAQAAHDTQRASLGQKAIERLDASIIEVARDLVPPALYGGFCGVGWLTSWLPKVLPEHAPTAPQPDPGAADEDPCLEIDEALEARLAARAWDGAYDLISGLVGFGVYALERLPNPSGERLLRLVIEQLQRSATALDGGVTWFTPPERLPERQRVEAPSGYYNLGVAHGVPGIIGFLGHACRAGVAVDEARPLLDGAVAFVLAQQLSDGEGARYPSWNAPGRAPRAARMAWCYGGLGLSTALMLAGQAVRNAAWQREAVRLALMESERPLERTGVHDASLCHGAAGNALIWRRFYEGTGEDRFLAAARAWYEKTLAMRTPGQGLGGYRFWEVLEPGNPSASRGFMSDASFLSGSAGVALALLAATSSSEPTWDRLLLTDIPTRA